MKNYFENCHTHDEGKKLYRKLAMKLHPDKEGGSEAEFQELNRQYREFCAGLNNSRNDSEQKYDWRFDVAQVLRQLNLNLRFISPTSPIADIAQNNIASRLCDLFGVDGTRVRQIENIAKNMIKNEN